MRAEIWKGRVKPGKSPGSDGWRVYHLTIHKSLGEYPAGNELRRLPCEWKMVVTLFPHFSLLEAHIAGRNPISTRLTHGIQ